jgi:hypothetical protein
MVQKEKSYAAVERFVKSGMKQVNIHFMLAEETVPWAKQTVKDIKNDPRLRGMNAIVFLQYKSKGRNPGAFHSIQSVGTYKELIACCDEAGINYGFDSCSAPLYLKSIEGTPKQQEFAQFAEPCESFGMFSSYINCLSEYFPCSFCEGEAGWEQGMNVLDCNDFLRDIWFSKRLDEWRQKMMQSTSGCHCVFQKQCRVCPIFDVTPCKMESQHG